MRNSTEYFLSKLFPDLSIINYVPDTNYETNNVIHRKIICYGDTGSGKSETIRKIVEYGVEKYGLENVNAAFVRRGKDLGSLLRHGLEDRLVNILFCDNITLYKPGKHELQDFFFIRHIYRKMYGRNNGLIITALGAHRLTGKEMEIALRTNVDFIIFRCTATNIWDRNLVRKHIGENGIEVLDILEDIRENQRNYFRYSVFYSKRKIGIFDTPLAKVNYLREIETPPKAVKDYLERLVR